MCAVNFQELPEDEQTPFLGIVEIALALDKLYIPTRYPGALAELTPAEAFTKKEGKAAIASAQEILDFVKSCIYASNNTENDRAKQKKKNR